MGYGIKSHVAEDITIIAPTNQSRSKEEKVIGNEGTNKTVKE
jgi:hypothetical protein